MLTLFFLISTAADVEVEVEEVIKEDIEGEGEPKVTEDSGADENEGKEVEVGEDDISPLFCTIRGPDKTLFVDSRS